MRIVLLYLKWSYGIEVLADQLSRQFERIAQVSIVAGAKPDFKPGMRASWQEGHLDSALALFNPLVQVRLLREIRANDPQVIYFISPHVLNVPLVLLCRWFTHAVVISHIHDPEYAGRPLVAATANTVARLQSRWSHRVFCWGNAIKEAISRDFTVPTDRIAVFAHGPGHKTPADRSGAGPGGAAPRYFSLIGTIIPRKGVEYFLEAARLFNERYGTDAAGFLLAGYGDLTAYHAAIDMLPNLQVVNRFVEDAEVNEFLANSYALVLPYTAGVMQSSLIAIAYGNGCPVIVSNLGSLPEEVEVGRTGYVVEKANAVQIADAMTRIYADPERARRREDCLATYRERFNWDTIADQMYRDMESAVRQLEGKHGLARQVSEDR